MPFVEGTPSWGQIHLTQTQTPTRSGGSWEYDRYVGAYPAARHARVVYLHLKHMVGFIKLSMHEDIIKRKPRQGIKVLKTESIFNHVLYVNGVTIFEKKMRRCFIRTPTKWTNCSIWTSPLF
jgi:hypothetical protein